LQASAKAHSNMALIKYWGKRDETLMLPHNSSFSVTLDALYTTTTVAFDAALDHDILILNGREAEEKAKLKVSRFLDIVREMAGVNIHAKVTSQNSFPTGAGLASSASGFAALACAASKAAGLDLDGKALSMLARRGSGSACRSIYGGFVEWQKGVKLDGSDSYAIPVASPEHWPLSLLIATVSDKQKKISSREGMAKTVATSPFYNSWLNTIEEDLAQAKAAVQNRDLDTLGKVAERNALRMHATMLSADPPFLYWQKGTIAVIREVESLRESGIPAYFTIDAGANVAVLCEPSHAAQIKEKLLRLREVQNVIVSGPGPGVTLL